MTIFRLERGLTDFTLHDTEPLMDWHLDDTEVLVEAWFNEPCVPEFS